LTWKDGLFRSLSGMTPEIQWHDTVKYSGMTPWNALAELWKDFNTWPSFSNGKCTTHGPGGKSF